MVEVTNAVPVVDVSQPPASWLGDNPVANASIASYLAAGQSMLSLADLTWKVCAALFVLVLAAWAFGLLPGAVRLL